MSGAAHIGIAAQLEEKSPPQRASIVDLAHDTLEDRLGDCFVFSPVVGRRTGGTEPGKSLMAGRRSLFLARARIALSCSW